MTLKTVLSTFPDYLLGTILIWPEHLELEMILINRFPNKIDILLLALGEEVPDWEGMSFSHIPSDIWLPPRDFRQAMRDIPGDSTCPPCSRLSPVLCDPMDCSLPGSSIYGILQARILKWVSISSSKRSSLPRDRTCISCVSWIGSQFFTTSSTWDAPYFSLTSPELCRHPQLVSMETSQFKH